MHWEMNKGFTAVEILLALAFVAIAAGTAAPVLYSYQSRNDLDVTESVLVQVIRKAAMNAKFELLDSSWGVHVTSGTITLFRGTSYASRVQADDKAYQISGPIIAAGPDILFAKFTGRPALAGTVTLTGTGGEGRVVSINSMGSISSNITSSLPGGTPVFPELGITAPLILADGGTHAVGSISAGVAQNIVYTIQNSGDGAAVLSGSPRVVITPISNIQSVVVTIQPPATIAPGSTGSFTVSYTAALPGPFSFTVSFANDDADENPYNWTVSGTATAGPGIPEMNVNYLGVSIVDGSIRNIGLMPTATASEIDFDIQNTGTGTLFITGTPKIVLAPILNVSAVNVAVDSPASIPAGGSATIRVSFTPDAIGLFRFSVSLETSDSNENPYNWTIRGSGE